MNADRALINDGSLDVILEFLPVFEREGFEFGEWSCLSDGCQAVRYAPEVNRFCKALRNNGFLVLAPWNGNMVDLILEDPKYGRIATASLDELRSLMSAIVRNDTLREGYLLAMLNTGVVTAVLRRLQELRAAREHKPEPHVAAPRSKKNEARLTDV